MENFDTLLFIWMCMWKRNQSNALQISSIYYSVSSKPENPFQNYELAKKILEKEKKFLCLKNTLIQPLEVQKPETGQKTGPRTTGKILCANEPV